MKALRFVLVSCLLTTPTVVQGLSCVTDNNGIVHCEDQITVTGSGTSIGGIPIGSVGGEGGTGSGGGGGTNYAAQLRNLPLVSGTLKTNVDAAKAEAIQKLLGYFCSGLWPTNGLPGTGIGWILSADFRDGSGPGTFCASSNANAWTLVGQSDQIVALCPGFLGRPLSDMSQTLIHESLHLAGLREAPAPAPPGVMTPDQTVTMVAQNCP